MMSRRKLFIFYFFHFSLYHVPCSVIVQVRMAWYPIVTVAKRYYSDTLNLIEACTGGVAIKLKPRLYRFLVFRYFAAAAVGVRASSTNTNLTSLDICTGELYC